MSDKITIKGKDKPVLAFLKRIKDLEAENEQLRETIEVMSDSKLMKRLEQAMNNRDKGIPFEEFKKKLDKLKHTPQGEGE